MGEGNGCARPTGARVNGRHENAGEKMTMEHADSATGVQARVGYAAPDFEAPAYYRGKFTTLKLSEYLGKWVLLCFYPGDFTFV